MNIAKLIAKFVKEGYEALTKEEIALLKENKALLSVSQLKDFEDADVETEEEETDEDEDDEDETDEEGTEEDLDEEGLKSLIQKGVKNEVAAKVDALADELVKAFMSKAKKQRAKGIDKGVQFKDKSQNETRQFMKALIGKDDKTLLEMHKKTTTYNYDDGGARGGYLVPDELRAEILRIAEKQYGLCRREMRYLPFSGPGNSRTIPTVASSVSVYWTDEAAAKTSSNPTFGLVTQTLKKLACIVPFTEELLEDSAVNITQLVAELVAEAIAKEEDTQFLYGTGSPWTGVLNNGSVGSVALGTAVGVSGVSIEKLIDMQDEMSSGALVGAKYYMNRQIYSYIRKLRADAVSASDSKGMFLLPPSKADIEDMLGYPIEFSDAMPGKTLTGASKPFVIFGNLKLAAIFGDKQQIRAKMLDQATITDGDGSTTINLAQQDMIALRFEERVGYLLALPTAVVVLTTGAAS